MINVTITKNTFNRSRATKYQVLCSLVNKIKYETFPNASGQCETQVRKLFGGHCYYPDAPLSNCLVKTVSGDPYSAGRYTVDPSLLTMEQVSKIQAGEYDYLLKSY